MPKEIRFGELVRRSGEPEMVSLWSNPKRNHSFMEAVKENRVLTITQQPSSKGRDFGRIGFHPDSHVTYLVFPKPLPSDKTPRVIGIKYDLISQPGVADPIALAEAPEKTVSKARQEERRQRRFDVIIRRTVIIETCVTISATDQPAAKRLAKQKVKAEPFDLSKAVVRNEVIGVQAGSG